MNEAKAKELAHELAMEYLKEKKMLRIFKNPKLKKMI